MLSSSLRWTLLFLYAIGRITQLFADRLPPILIVLLHVLPPALFALLHGATLYRFKGILTFFACTCGVAAIYESIALRTGFPFGHYYFTDLMGPKLFQLPVLLVLAYFGIGYAAWILALLILDYRGKPIIGLRLLTLPILASFIMTAWDLSMEADWATLNRAWVWQSGGAFFGVPIGNFFGWYLNTFTQYLLFALFLRGTPLTIREFSTEFWLSPIVLYLICSLGNLLRPLLPMAPPHVTDPSGHPWLTSDILSTVVLMSSLVMTPLAVLALLRLKETTQIEARAARENRYDRD